ncbi:hypothetical protein D3875_15985 [Deinococcus cavernae]|uniref:Ig-like domain-containing protein n=1 Tax=Deinococcus cavernae TaxID=2320857 RepID=A0A418V9Q0_9DEIO|nr:Ig-like domain-containing protein [Deinococcus cavernae]RJF72820.1 hypothetical protein D3875_15985 [Deinococcus cavernae]
MKKNVALMALTGILTLASCSQGPDTTDKTNPAVTLSANPTSLAKEGGTTTLTANASDNVAVTKVEFYRDGAKIGEDTTSPFTYVDTLAANATTSTKSYSYTAKAFDAAANSATSSAVAVTVAATNSTPDNPSNGDATYNLSITSPTSGSTVTSNNVQLQYTFSGLTDLQCGVEGKLAAPSNPGSTSGACNIDLTGIANGPVKLVVTGKDSKGTVRTAFVTVTKAVNAPVPNTDVTFGPIMTTDANGYVDYSKYRLGGVRTINQGNNPPSPDPLPGNGNLMYVKGNVDVKFNAPAGATRVEAWVHGTIDGSRTGALKYLYDGAPGATYKWNTTELNGQQSRVLYLVVRTYGADGQQTLRSYPFVVDNTGPQAADPDLEGATDPGSRFLRDFGGPNQNWAKGKIQVFTSNTNLTDLVYNVPTGQILPAGVDYVNYYFVPVSQLSRITTIQGQQRVLDIINNSKFNTGRIEDAQGTGSKRDFRTIVDSTDGSKDGRYAVFAVTVDEMGNESASTTYENIGFDNIGPSAQTVSLYDSSPLPFPSADPQLYISDWFRISGAISDSGVGFNSSFFVNGTVNLCGNVYPAARFFVNPPGGISTPVSTIDFSEVELDSNVVVPADGECEVTFSGPDALGNIKTFTGQKVIFDNTDPVNNIQQPLEGKTFNAGTTVNFEANISDVTSQINPRFTKTFWNDYVVPAEANPIGATAVPRTRANGFIAAPVEFRTDPIGSTGNPVFATSLNGGWFALYPGLLDQDEENAARPMQLHSLAVDCAGNATVQNRRVMIAPVSNSNLPKVGDFDAYYRNTAPQYKPVPADNATHVYTTELLSVFDTQRDINIDMANNSGISGGANSTGTYSRAGSTIESVNFFRQLDVAAWNDMVYWQTHAYMGDWTGGSAMDPNGDPTLKVRAGSDLATRRNAWKYLTENIDGGQRVAPTAPWWLAGDTETSSAIHRTTTGLRGEFAFAGASALAGLVSDNVGNYRAAAEGVVSITTVNTTAQSVLDKTYGAGDEVDRFQFVVTTPIALTASSTISGNIYALQARVGTGAWVTIPLSYSNSVGGVVFTTDGGENAPLTPGINNVQANYTFGTTKFTEFRLVENSTGGYFFPGQSFLVKSQ